LTTIARCEENFRLWPKWFKSLRGDACEKRAACLNAEQF
jgi:hypothetical protein